MNAPCESKDRRVITAAHVTNLVADLRANEVDVRIDGTRGEDVALTRQRLGRYTDNHTGSHALHHVRIASLTNPGDQAVLDANVGLQVGICLRVIEKKVTSIICPLEYSLYNSNKCTKRSPTL